MNIDDLRKCDGCDIFKNRVLFINVEDNKILCLFCFGEMSYIGFKQRKKSLTIDQVRKRRIKK
jgi:hypothetical protein